MVSNLPTVALFAKYPVPGLAKTRLIPALGAEGAAMVHRRLVERTLRVIRESGLPFTVWTTGAPHSDFAAWLGSDVPLMAQSEGDLGERLACALTPAILLGADIPDLSADHLRDAAALLRNAPAVIGPALDGGYYLLALRDPAPFLFTDMEWGTHTVLRETQRRLDAHNVPYRLLGELADCDRPEDLAKWPELSE